MISPPSQSPTRILTQVGLSSMPILLVMGAYTAIRVFPRIILGGVHPGIFCAI